VTVSTTWVPRMLKVRAVPTVLSVPLRLTVSYGGAGLGDVLEGADDGHFARRCKE